MWGAPTSFSCDLSVLSSWVAPISPGARCETGRGGGGGTRRLCMFTCPLASVGTRDAQQTPFPDGPRLTVRQHLRQGLSGTTCSLSPSGDWGDTQPAAHLLQPLLLSLGSCQALSNCLEKERNETNTPRRWGPSSHHVFFILLAAR